MAESSNNSAEAASFVSKEDFEVFCEEMYPHGSLTKTLRRERRERITEWLKGNASPPHGRNWTQRIKEKGYTNVNFPEFGLQDVLCVKGQEEDGAIPHGTYGEWRKVVSVEELYDVMLHAHVRILNHGGYRKLTKALELDYVGVPKAAILKFVALCQQCRQNPKQQSRALLNSRGKIKLVKMPTITRKFNRRCQIDVVDMRLCADGQYCYVGLYTDHWTQFVTLYPMTGCTPEHVAYGLASSVYPYYGPPHFLHSTEGEEFAQSVVSLSIEKWKGGPVTVVPRAKEALMHMKESVERTRTLLIQLMNKRAVKENLQGRLPWAGWLGKIMYDLNNQLNESPGKSPYKRVFDRTLLSSTGDATQSSESSSVGAGQSSEEAGTRRKRKRCSSYSAKDAAVVLTSFKTPQLARAGKPLKRPSTFIAIDNKR